MQSQTLNQLTSHTTAHWPAHAVADTPVTQCE